MNHKSASLARYACGTAAIVITVTRSLDWFSHPRFWAEDGTLWYQQALVYGWHAMLKPAEGYYQLISRIVAELSLAFPVSAAPSFFIFAALFIQLSPALFLLTKRGSSLFKHPSVACAAALVLVLLPSSSEINLAVTNSQWHLGLLGVEITALYLGPYRHNKLLIRDTVAAIICFLSGPFVVLILGALLVTLAIAKLKRSAETVTIHPAVMVLIVISSLFEFISNRIGPPRTQFPILNPIIQAGLYGEHAIGGLLLGERTSTIVFASWINSSAIHPKVAAISMVIILAEVIWTLISKNSRINLLIWYGLIAFEAAMFFPNMPGSAVPFSDPQLATRYFFLPMCGLLAFLAAVTHNLFSRSRERPTAKALTGVLAAIASLTLLVAISKDFVLEYVPAPSWTHQLSVFKNSGEQTHQLAIAPPGWYVDLNRHDVLVRRILP